MQKRKLVRRPARAASNKSMDLAPPKGALQLQLGLISKFNQDLNIGFCNIRGGKKDGQLDFFECYMKVKRFR